jgi:protein-disulfide isomerase
MRRYLPFSIVAFVALVMIGSAMFLYRAKRPSMLTMTNETSASGDSLHVLGNAQAPVTLEEFGDFECPPCGGLSEPINQLEKEYRPNLRVIFHHFPLIMHAHAREASLAAEAAGLQAHFWEMHDLLYREQSVWSKVTDPRALFNSYAGMLGLNVERFKRDMAGEEAKARVTKDEKEGASIGVHNTPTIFINNRAVDLKIVSPETLRAAVKEAVEAKHPSS